MTIRVSIALLLATAASLAGCAKPPLDPSLADIAAYIDQQTAFTADNEQYAAQYGALAPYAVNSVDLIPSRPETELLLLVDGNFNGSVEDLTKQVAALLNYRVAANGEKPGAPIYVAVQQYNLSALGLLREGFAQARTRATLTINQASKVMTVNYTRPENSPVPHQDDVIL